MAPAQMVPALLIQSNTPVSHNYSVISDLRNQRWTAFGARDSQHKSCNHGIVSICGVLKKQLHLRYQCIRFQQQRAGHLTHSSKRERMSNAWSVNRNIQLATAHVTVKTTISTRQGKWPKKNGLAVAGMHAGCVCLATAGRGMAGQTFHQSTQSRRWESGRRAKSPWAAAYVSPSLTASFLYACVSTQ